VSEAGGWREPAWIPAESPGGIGAPEVWIDAHALDYHHSGKLPTITLVLHGNGGGPWIGRLLQFGSYPGAEAEEITYMVVARRWISEHNHGQPYYVARIPDPTAAGGTS
jgi:hypothetical protein